MAKNKKVTINDIDYTLQSVSMTWYLDQLDKYGIVGSGKRDTRGYWDTLFRNVVISPPEITSQGISYFDKADDMSLGFKLHSEIESFLTE
ncbi:hypothetical protein FACS1894184_14580 [Clostridia bacterium]|nr:hypothetical protein FACS1894184_14580 [Clostridia bacterium]